MAKGMCEYCGRNECQFRNDKKGWITVCDQYIKPDVLNAHEVVCKYATAAEMVDKYVLHPEIPEVREELL